jgi:hypothetical protein
MKTLKCVRLVCLVCKSQVLSIVRPPYSRFCPVWRSRSLLPVPRPCTRRRSVVVATLARNTDAIPISTNTNILVFTYTLFACYHMCSAVEGVGLCPLAYWDCGFESHRGHGCPSLLSIVCCQVEVSVSGCSFVQRSPPECGVSDCDREPREWGSPGPLGAVLPWRK